MKSQDTSMMSWPWATKQESNKKAADRNPASSPSEIEGNLMLMRELVAAFGRDVDLERSSHGHGRHGKVDAGHHGTPRRMRQVAIE